MINTYPLLAEHFAQKSFDEMLTEVSARDFPENRIYKLVNDDDQWVSLEDWSLPSLHDPSSVITPQELRKNCSRVIDLYDSIRHIQPSQIGSEFDAQCSTLLHDALPIDRSVAANPEFWLAVNFRVLPEIAFWRWPFGDLSERNRKDRLMDAGYRSVFARLWWRAEIFGPHLSEHLMGDIVDQLFERRRSIASNREIALLCIAALFSDEQIEPTVIANASDAGNGAVRNDNVLTWTYKLKDCNRRLEFLSRVGQVSILHDFWGLSFEQKRSLLEKAAQEFGLEIKSDTAVFSEIEKLFSA